jgi:uncharacterized iron-regulated protein
VRLDQQDVVLIGEQHDDPNSHRLEADIAHSLFAANMYKRSQAIAMEMFERDVQEVIEQHRPYGKFREALEHGSSEAEFLEASRAWPNYSTDYAPVLEPYWGYGLGDRLSTPIIGSNAPTSIARRVAKEGLDAVLNSLSPEQRGWVAETTTSPKDQYWQHFLEAMGGGGSASDAAHGMGMTEDQIYGFYQAQCLKDDTMAESIARLRESDPQRQVVHLSGSFHIDYHLGIYPRLVQRRPQDKVVTVALRPVENFEDATLQAALDAEPGVADYVVFVLREETSKP